MVFSTRPIAAVSRRLDRWGVQLGSMIDALSRRSPAIVLFTLGATLLCAFVGAPTWVPTTLAAVVAVLALALFAARGGGQARSGLGDRRSWLEWELAGKGTPPGSYLLGFFGFLTIVLTGFDSIYARPAWAALVLGIVWGIANRTYPADEDADA